MNEGYCRSVLVCVLLVVPFSIGMNLTSSSIPEPIVTGGDLHFAPPALEASPSNPNVGTPVQITAHVTLDAKQSWTKYGVVLDRGAPGEKDSWELNSQSVMYDNGEYRMWYSGTEGVYPHGWIMYANSSDGITWARHGVVLDYGEPGETENVHFCYVMKESATYKMWYAGYDGSNYRILYATSSDGLTWTKHGIVLDLGPPGSYDDLFVYKPFVILEGGVYKMWYTGNDGAVTRLLYAESSDGVSWVKKGLALDLGAPGSLDSHGVSGAYIMKEGGGYHMWYTGYDGSHLRIFYATSADAGAWTRRGMVIDVGPPGSTDASRSYFASVLHLPGKPYQLWYTGRSDVTIYDRIHYAYASSLPIPVSTSVDFYRDSIVPGNRIGGGAVSVSPGSVANITITWIASPAGTHVIYSVIDILGKVAETDETNNVASIVVKVGTQPPEAEAGGPYTGVEGDMIHLDGSGSSDPDSPITGWRWDLENDGMWDTPWLTTPYYNWTWGDDYIGQVALEVTDSANNDTDTANVTITNLLPSGTVSITSAQHEGSPITFSAHVTDPGSDDIFFTWKWGFGAPDEKSTYYNNGVGPDPYPSPDINPRDVTDVKTHTYGDNGAFTVTVFVQDDDSGNQGTTLQITATPDNLPPSVNVSGGMSIYEGQSVVLTAIATDPGSDDLTFNWSWGEGSSESRTYYNNGVSPDPPQSPGGMWPFTGTDIATHAYGDNGIFTITLRVTDDDGGVTTYETDVTVSNMLPSGTLRITSSQQHEGYLIEFSANITDPGSDDIFLTWKWGYGAPDERSVYYNNGVGPDPYPSPDIHPRNLTDAKTHIYGDNGVFVVIVFVQDDDSGSNGTTLQITATPDNLSPTVQVSGGMSIDEGQSVSLTAVGKDPGSDDLTFDWDWGEGSTSSKTYYNDGIGPDPYPSPGGNYPFAATDTATHAYGDNGAYMITLKVTDDDGGFTTWSGQLTVINLPPVVRPFGPFAVDEGSPLSVNTTATDPGSDDLTFTWSFELGPTSQTIYYNDGVGPDPYPSPGGTYPFTANDIANWTYGDNGVYTLTLIVTDDDGGVTVRTTNVTVVNLPPVIAPFGPFVVNEGDSVSMMTNATDAGSDDLTFTWIFEYGPTIQRVFYNDGIGPDPPMSPNGTFPFPVTDSAAHTYGDNGVFNITLAVEDDDGGIATYETAVTVNNVAPIIDGIQAYVVANITLRVAGEKWHDVCLNMVHDGDVEDSACVVRYPGSPDDQSVTIVGGRIELTGDFRIVLYYTPDDDPINGQPNGANPVWVTVDLPGGSQVRLRHTFNVQHPDTWVWTLDDIRPYLVGVDITFSASASDAGSDDLTFTWSWGDGTPEGVATYFNDGVSPDPYPSPDGTFPFAASDLTAHAFAAPGTYSVTLTVADDDGGSVSTMLDITVG